MRLDIRALLTGEARLVAHVTRFSGTPLLRPENVAEHSYMTAQYAFFIARAIETDTLHPTDVDLGQLLSRALVHDMDECLLGDLPRPVKYANTEVLRGWNAMAEQAVTQVGETLGVTFTQDWKFAKKPNSLEGDIMALADMISVTAYIIEELRLGNTYMRKLLAGNIGYLQELKEKRGFQHSLLLQFTDDAIRVASDTLDKYTP